MPKKLKILHVEDNLAEVKLVEQAFEEACIEKELYVVRDGEEAIKYLSKEGPFAKAARPDLVLLDLNLPKKNGFEVLYAIKSDPHLKTIPIYIFTGSESKDDIAKAYQLHVNGYIKKPNGFAEYVSFLKTLCEFFSNTLVVTS
jgi:CheY-like chemotaxis protein